MSADRYLEPAFIRELRAKAVLYRIGADQYKSSAGEPFPKDLPQKDTCFQAIANIRRRGWAEQKLEHDLAPAEDQEFERFSIRDFFDANELTAKGLIEIRDELLGPKDPADEKLLADECVVAVRRGEIGRLKDIVKFCKIFESKTYGRPSQQTTKRKRDPVPWHYYAAVTALAFLKKGKIPSRSEVIESALRERAIDEPPVMPQTGGTPKEMREDPEPTEDQDPGSYYGGEQPGPVSTPDWQAREAEADQQLTEQQTQKGPPERLSEEDKPALVKDHEQQIAAKIEELRSRQPKNWKRIFIDLGLEQLAP